MYHRVYECPNIPLHFGVCGLMHDMFIKTNNQSTAHHGTAASISHSFWYCFSNGESLLCQEAAP